MKIKGVLTLLHVCHVRSLRIGEKKIFFSNYSWRLKAVQKLTKSQKLTIRVPSNPTQNTSNFCHEFGEGDCLKGAFNIGCQWGCPGDSDEFKTHYFVYQFWVLWINHLLCRYMHALETYSDGIWKLWTSLCKVCFTIIDCDDMWE